MNACYKCICGLQGQIILDRISNSQQEIAVGILLKFCSTSQLKDNYQF